MIKLNTARFGEIEVSPENVFVFPGGLLGFSKDARFTLLENVLAEQSIYLQSVDNPDLGFIVIEPLRERPDFSFHITRDDLAIIGAGEVSEIRLLIIESKLNYGPLILNLKTKLGHQLSLKQDNTAEPIIFPVE